MHKEDLCIKRRIGRAKTRWQESWMRKAMPNGNRGRIKN